MNLQNTYIVPYASGFGKKKYVDPTAKARCDTALKVAHKEENAIFVLGAGLSELGYTHYGRSSLAEEMAKYLKSKDWPAEKIITNPLGYDTVGETAAAIEVIRLMGEGKIIAVTSWFHKFRVYLIWRIGFRRKVKVISAPALVGLKTVLGEIIKVPVSVAAAIGIRSRV